MSEFNYQKLVMKAVNNGSICIHLATFLLNNNRLQFEAKRVFN